MANPTAAALFHNTATRVTFGSAPFNAVPVAVAQKLRPLLELSTSLTALTLHTQYTPPESLRLLLLGASRCRSLQCVRVVGGVSVLQSQMMMAALAQFTLDRRPETRTPRRCPHAPPVRRPSGGYNRPSAAAKSPPSRFSCLSGVHFVLELHHLDDVAASFLLRGLERSERITGLDVHIVSTSQAAARAATRMLSHANAIVDRNVRRVSYLLAHYAPRHAAPVQDVIKPDGMCHVPRSPFSNDVPLASPADADDETRRRKAVAMTREPSASDLCGVPSRRYSPPRLQSGGVLPDPPPYSPRPRVPNARLRFLSNEAGVRHAPNDDEQDDAHSNGCFVCGGGVSQTPERAAASRAPSVKAGGRAERTREEVSAQPTPRNQPLDSTQPSMFLSPKTPCSSPSSSGQRVQHVRYLRGCVRDLNAVVVHYQVVSRESIQRFATEMRAFEDQLTEKVTTKLTDMMISLSDLERQDG